MSLSDLLNGKAFEADQNDLSHSAASRLSGRRVLFASAERASIRYRSLRYSQSGVDAAFVGPEESGDFEARGDSSGLILSTSEISPHVMTVRGGKPRPYSEDRVRAVHMRAPKGIDAVLGAKVNVSSDVMTPVIVASRLHNVQLVFQVKRVVADALEARANGKPVASMICAAVCALAAIAETKSEFFKTGDVVIRDENLVIVLSGRPDGDWNDPVVHTAESPTETAANIGSFLTSRLRAGITDRALGFVNLGGAPLPEFAMASVISEAQQASGFYCDGAEAVALALSPGVLRPSLDIRTTIPAVREILPSWARPIPKILVASFGIGLLASVALAAHLGKSKKHVAESKKNAESAKAALAAVQQTHAELTRQVDGATAYARWIALGTNPQTIVAIAAETLTDSRIDSLIVAPVDDGERLSIKLELTPISKTEGSNKGINRFEEALRTKAGLRYYSGSPATGADRVSYTSVFERTTSNL